MPGFRRMMSYLGLVDDDEYDEYDPYDDQGGGSRQRQGAAVGASVGAASGGGSNGGDGPDGSGSHSLRTLAREPGEPMSGVTVTPRSAVVRPMTAAAPAKPHTVSPHSFQDAQEIADRLKGGVPVIVNLQAADRDLLRRIIDFSSGLTYGIGGEMERTADRVYLLTPTARG